MDGKRYASTHQYFDVPEYPKFSVSNFNDNEVVGPVTINHFRYRRESFGTPDGQITMWVPDGQSPIETMQRILKRYEENRWRPMSTAWKDGRRILVHDGADTYIAFWGEMYSMMLRSPIEAWWVRADFNLSNENLRGWMPLPEMPDER